MFSSLIGFRGICVALALMLPLAAARVNAACDNIVALSRGWVEYMVLDPETLATLRVGDLRWLGIRSVYFVASGSSFERSVLNSYDYLRVNSHDPVIEGFEGYVGRYGGASSAFTLLSLQNLGEDLRSQDDIPIMDSGSIMVGRERIVWADWIEENTLLREIYDRDGHYIAGYDLLDTDFNVLRRWAPKVGFSIQFPSCAIDDRIYFAGMRGVHVFDDQGGTIFELESLQRENLRLVPVHAKNCKALAFRDYPDDNPMRGAVLVDVITGALGPEFEIPYDNGYLLFDDGNRLLLQEKERTFVTSERGERVPYRSVLTNRFSLIDTTTGEVLLEKALEIGSGVLEREMLCDGETPRALVQDVDTMYLIDPNTLEITVSRTMPEGWGGYEIFE